MSWPRELLHSGSRSGFVVCSAGMVESQLLSNHSDTPGMVSVAMIHSMKFSCGRTSLRTSCKLAPRLLARLLLDGSFLTLPSED